jgi:hypothetical protein
MMSATISQQLLLIMLAIIQSHAYPVTTSRKLNLFYIYETDEWHAIANASQISKDQLGEIKDHSMNSGAGVLINITTGAYHTDQYQLYNLIIGRALKDPRRTLDPSKATTFLIPYDIAFDAAFYKKCPRGACFATHKCPSAPSVNALLKASPWYARNKGRDHLLIVGLNYGMIYYIGKPNCKQLLVDSCYNCTKVAIDDYSYLHATNKGLLGQGDYWHAVPFPADFHYTKHVKKPFPWDNRDRPYLSSYVGSIKSYDRQAQRLREAIVHYCDKHEKMCKHTSYGANNSRESSKVEGHNPLQLSASSIFCFQPIGDLPTRKGLFDSILQGCIPVTFDALTASSMYTWHWEEEFWLSVSIQFPFQKVIKHNFDVVLALNELMLHNATLILEKQELIKERVFELQYSLDGRLEGFEKEDTAKARGFNGKRDVKSDSDSDLKISGNWPRYSNGTPKRDAYDLIMDHVFGWHSGVESDVRNGTVPKCWNGYLDIEVNKCKPYAETKVNKNNYKQFI